MMDDVEAEIECWRDDWFAEKRRVSATPARVCSR